MGRPKGYVMSEESKKKTSESMKNKHNAKGKHWKWHKKECESCKL